MSGSPMAMVQPNVEVCRILNPNDANIHGKVHGGTILQLIEEAGYIASYKHCNRDHQQSDRKIIPLLCRIERTTFLIQIDLAEVAIVKAHIQFSTEKTLCVKVNVFTDNLFSGDQQLKCTSTLWYCGTIMDNTAHTITPVTVPQVKCVDPEFEKLLRENAKQNKDHRQNFPEFEKRLMESLYRTSVQVCFPSPSSSSSTINGNGTLLHSVSASTTITYHLVTRSECTSTGILTGGCLLKKMDECGAIAAVKHCRNLLVTGCLEAVEFHAPTNHGALLLLVARVTFCSKRSLDVDVVAIEENPIDNHGCSPRLICSSFFTYVTIAAPSYPLKDVPPLVLTTDEEKQRHDEGEQRYINRRKK